MTYKTDKKEEIKIKSRRKRSIQEAEKTINNNSSPINTRQWPQVSDRTQCFRLYHWESAISTTRQ